MSAHTYLPATADIAAVFEEECRERGADTVDCYRQEQRLLARAVFGPPRAVRPGDQIRGGVAVRLDGPALVVHPFSWRQICSNGAIAPMVLGSHRIELLEVDVTTASAAFTGSVVAELRDAIATCAGPVCLEECVEMMRRATEVDGALAITLLTHLLRAQTDVEREMLMRMIERHGAGGDPSAYGVFNAVTSLARDTADPDLRWRLEALGGQLLQSAVTHSMRTAAPMRRDSLVSA